MVEGSSRRTEVSNIQVVQESTYCELKLSLVDEEGVFLETDPTVKSMKSVTSELEGLSEALAKAMLQSTALRSSTILLICWRKHTAELTSKVAEYEQAEGHGDPGEVDKLKADLKAAKNSQADVETQL